MYCKNIRKCYSFEIVCLTLYELLLARYDTGLLSNSICQYVKTRTNLGSVPSLSYVSAQ